MNCNVARDLSDEYLDGMLSDLQKKEFEAHLDTCPECLASIQQMRQMLRFLSSMEEEELPAGFRARLHGRLQAAAEETSAAKNGNPFVTGRKWMRWGAGLAAAIVLLLSVRLVSQLDGLTGEKGAAPDTTTEQSLYGKLFLKNEMQEKPAGELENSADAPLETAGELTGSGAPEADTPMMISATAAEDSPAAYDAKNVDESGKMSDHAKQSEPAESNMRILTAEAALSGEFNLYVSDTDAVFNKISVIAASMGMTVTEETDNIVVLQITDEAQRTNLYDHLAKLGRVEDLGIFKEDNTVTVHVVVEK